VLSFAAAALGSLAAGYAVMAIGSLDSIGLFGFTNQNITEHSDSPPRLVPLSQHRQRRTKHFESQAEQITPPNNQFFNRIQKTIPKSSNR
jgi:hypothetical protein